MTGLFDKKKGVDAESRFVAEGGKRAASREWLAIRDLVVTSIVERATSDQ